MDNPDDNDNDNGHSNLQDALHKLAVKELSGDRFIAQNTFMKMLTNDSLRINFTRFALKEEQMIENIFHQLNQCVDKTWLKNSVGVLAFGDP